MPLTPPETPDDILMRAIAGGDPDAFRALYARYSRPLFALALRLLGDAGAAEEALQDAFLKIWRQAGTYDAGLSRPFTWAVTIVRRTCLDHLRRVRCNPVLVPLAADEPCGVRLAGSETVRRDAEAGEIRAQVGAALATFDSPQRMALELALFTALSHAEIAGRLAQPMGTIKTWIRRGLLDLRATLHKPPL